MTKLKLSFLTCLCSMIFASSTAYAESALASARKYIQSINRSSTQEQYLSYWIQPAQDHLLAKPEKLTREFERAIKMHEVFLVDGSADTTPTASSEMQGTITVYTYQLSSSIPMSTIYPSSSQTDFVLTEYQIVMQQENGIWKVTGETFVGTKQ